MKRPVIAVTADRRPVGLKPVSHRERPARAEVFVYEAMVSAVRNAGGEPLLLPPNERPDPGWFGWVVRACDGLVLTGGAVDLHPRHYGQDVAGRLDRVDEGRAALELGLAAAALEAGLPVLGVCGGLQTLAVASGGTLWQDILSFFPGGGEHEQPTDPATAWHEVALTGRLAALYGADRIAVNSTHHQAVRAPGAFEVTGRAPDGVVEAIEHPSHPYAVGVQWHPEILALGLGEGALAPFAGLIQAALKNRAPKRSEQAL